MNHQIVDTFATLSQTDMGWTEKIWTSIARTDGSLQIDFGLAVDEKLDDGPVMPRRV